MINALIRRLAPMIDVLVAAAALIVALAVIAVGAQASQQAADDYASAVPCESSADTASNCYRDVAARVTSVTYAAPSRQKGVPSGIGFYTIVLTDGQSQWTTQVSQRELPQTLSVGQVVQARVWRATVTQLSASGWSARTFSNPSGVSGALWAMVILVALVLAGLITVLARARLKRTRRAWSAHASQRT